MTNDHAPDDEFEGLDLEVHARVRAALRDVPPQPSEQADRAREAALSHLDAAPQTVGARTAGRARRPIWLTVAAAGVISVLGVAVLSRGAGAPSTTDVVERSADEAAVTMMQSEVPTGAAAAPDTSALDAIVAWVRASEPVDEATCPVEATERPYGRQLLNGVEVEVMVDLEAGMLRLVEMATCTVLVTTPLTP